MKFSLLFWLTCLLLAVVLKQFAVLQHFFLLRLVIFYAVSQALKWVIFRNCSVALRLSTENNTAIVTGASAGIGSCIASELCHRGSKVIWAARDVRKAERLLNDIRWTVHHGPRGYVLHVDLASKTSIRKFVDQFRQRETNLHCLILNAGYLGPRKLTDDGFEYTIGVNHLGHMYLVYLLLDLLKSSAPSRVVVVSSDLHVLSKEVRFDDLMFERDYLPHKAYNHSKLCNILFAKELAHHLSGSGVTVNAVHPGTPVPSDLTREHFLGNFLLRNVILPPLFHLFCRTANQAAQTAVYCAYSEECGNVTGQYFENLRLAKPSCTAEDLDAAARLWSVSCKLLSIPEVW